MFNQLKLLLIAVLPWIYRRKSPDYFWCWWKCLKSTIMRLVGSSTWFKRDVENEAQRKFISFFDVLVSSLDGSESALEAGCCWCKVLLFAMSNIPESVYWTNWGKTKQKQNMAATNRQTPRLQFNAMCLQYTLKVQFTVHALKCISCHTFSKLINNKQNNLHCKKNHCNKPPWS